MEFDEETASELIDGSLAQGLCSVAESDQVIGFVLGLAFPSILNKGYLMGAELAWWVEPAHRKSSAGIRLLRHIEKSARDLGIKAWSMMLLESLEPEKVEKIYLSIGYEPAERTFIKYL